MKILLDGMNLSLQKGTGVASYARNLALTAKALGHEVHVLYGEDIPRTSDAVALEADFFSPGSRMPAGRLRRLSRQAFGILGAEPWRVPLSDNVDKREISGRIPSMDFAWNWPDVFSIAHRHFALTGQFLVLKNSPNVDVAHWTYPVPIRLKDAKNVYTIHDLVPLRLPYTTLDRKQFYYSLTKKISDEADLIVTVSETSLNDIKNLLKTPSSKLANTYQSVNMPAVNKENIEESITVQTRNSIRRLKKGKYFMYYGAIEPKKNIDRIVEAFLQSECGIPLVIVGKDGWTSGEIPSSYRLDRIPSVYRVDYVSFRRLVALISCARAVVFPSLYEGFGLPIVEAMHLGTPVLTSNTGAPAEVAGEAALLVDPFDVDAISDGIARLASDDQLVEQLSAKGKRQSLAFSQGQYETRLDSAYRRLNTDVEEPDSG